MLSNHKRLAVEPLENRLLLSLVPELVRDINQQAPSSNPSNLLAIGDSVYFTAEDGASGRELWKSDGTQAGTVRVKDILPGDASSFASLFPSFLANVDGTVFFAADDGACGQELWKSDGTQAGTLRVKDILPGGTGSYPNDLTNVGGTLFFAADDGSGFELWKSDGTEAGTLRVKDIRPGSDGSFPSYLTDVGGALFFTANDGSSGFELWKSDGTQAGTVRVKDFGPGSASSLPLELSKVGGTLFFAAIDGSSGVELWKSDGTEAGTVRVKDIVPGNASSGPRFLANVGGALYFMAFGGASGYELWKSDGTEAGTVRVTEVSPRRDGYDPLFSLTDVGGTLFFAAYDGSSGTELWQSDGTEGGTIRVADIHPGSAPSDPLALTNVGGALFFSANDGAHGRELWKVAVATDVPPTADIVDVSPDPRTSAVDRVTIVFSEPVTGFDLSDLALTRNGGANLLTDSQTLTSGDQVSWTLGNLGSLSGAEGNYLLTLSAAGSGIVDAASGGLAGDATDSFVVNSSVIGRHVFYNNSSWDGTNATSAASDDEAIAPDKTALLPGGTATLANYTSYSKGINGIMVDIAGLSGTPTAADFSFKTGNVNDTNTWTALTTSPSMLVRPGAGTSGSTRVALTWSDGTILKKWLQVTVLANGNTGLLANDVFYFGNAVGEAGNSLVDAQVNAADELGARANPRNIANPAPITFLYDYNRDKQVNAADQLISRGNPTNLATRLQLITPTTGLTPADAGLADAAAMGGQADEGLLDVLAGVGQWRRRLA